VSLCTFDVPCNNNKDICQKKKLTFFTLFRQQDANFQLSVGAFHSSGTRWRSTVVAHREYSKRRWHSKTENLKNLEISGGKKKKKQHFAITRYGSTLNACFQLAVGSVICNEVEATGGKTTSPCCVWNVPFKMGVLSCAAEPRSLHHSKKKRWFI